ncbi:nucleotidyltransferase domain-containing protein [candidate division KSB1 bacterium]|nr:nucleotidyltransferase domain-containing protein [candidate division KSB1 bacterium]
MITREQINSLVSILTSKFPIKDIFLFGSYAKGNDSVTSDLDLCVTTRLANKRKIDLIRAIRKEISDTVDIPMDILVYDMDEFQQRAAHKNTFEYKIRNQRILLNG